MLPSIELRKYPIDRLSPPLSLRISSESISHRRNGLIIGDGFDRNTLSSRVETNEALATKLFVIIVKS